MWIFSAMNDLDCDDGLLRSSSGRTAQRDIVQFVPMNKLPLVKNDPIRLADEVLQELFLLNKSNIGHDLIISNLILSSYLSIHSNLIYITI